MLDFGVLNLKLGKFEPGGGGHSTFQVFYGPDFRSVGLAN